MTLELRELARAYDGFAFGPIDLDVGEEVLSVLGPSGSGKTTLCSLIAGIDQPDSGSVALDGRALVGRPLEARRVGMVFQEGALFPHMTARENVGYAATDGIRVEELATLLEIADVLDRRPPTLSGGERQRVALARTLAADPDVLLLDEPLSSLDAPIRRRLRNDLRSLFQSLDIPVVYVTHDQRTATALGDRIAVFDDGVIEQVGPPSTVVERPATRFVARFTGNDNLFEAAVVDRDEFGATLRVGEVTFRTNAHSGDASTVVACVHPSRVRLHESTASDGDDAISGRVRRWLNEGDAHRVVIDVDAAPLSLTASVRPPTFDRVVTHEGCRVRLTMPPASVHVI